MIEFNTIDLLRLSMNISALENKLAAKNIATGKSEQTMYVAEFGNMLNDLRQNDKLDVNQIASHNKRLLTNETEFIEKLSVSKDVDSFVSDTLKSAGDFNKAADILNRQLGMMRLAIKGGKA